MSKFFSFLGKKQGTAATTKASAPAVVASKKEVRREFIARDGNLPNDIVDAFSSLNNKEGSFAAAESPNQDSCSFGIFNGAEISAENFFSTSLAEIHKQVAKEPSRHKMGSTFCGGIYDPTLQKITIGNLGDSRAYLEMIDAENRKILVSLSEDFDPKVARFASQVTGNGGEITSSRVSGNIAVAGGFGDLDCKGMITTPDIINWDLETVSKMFPGFRPAKMIICSDGFTEKESEMSSLYNAVYTFEYDAQAPEKNAHKPLYNNIAKTAAKTREEIPLDAMAQKMISRSRFYESKDDISIVIIDLDKAKENGQPIFACVADGHRKGAEELSSMIVTKALEYARNPSLLLQEQIKPALAPALAQEQPSASPHAAAAQTRQLAGHQQGNVRSV